MLVIRLGDDRLVRCGGIGWVGSLPGLLPLCKFSSRAGNLCPRLLSGRMGVSISVGAWSTANRKSETGYMVDRGQESKEFGRLPGLLPVFKVSNKVGSSFLFLN